MIEYDEKWHIRFRETQNIIVKIWIMKFFEYLSQKGVDGVKNETSNLMTGHLKGTVAWDPALRQNVASHNVYVTKRNCY